MKIARLLAATALVLAMAPAVTASAAPTTIDSIAFDGFCDGLSMSFPSVGLGTPGTVDGFQTGCAANAVFGESAKTSFAKGDTYVTDGPDGLMYIIHKDRTWQLFGLDGSTLVLFFSGTWTPGPPTRSEGVAASSSVRSAGTTGTTARVPRKIKEISFDGLCDGMHFNIPSKGTGAKNTIDGSRTGCASGGLMGAKGVVTRASHSNVSNNFTFSADGGIWIGGSAFRDHTWVFYATDGTAMYVVNSGTWSKGRPGARTAGMKPSI